VLINTPYVSELVKRGSVGEIKPIMEKGAAAGMQTFDQSLYDLYKSERISLDDALGNADSRGNLEWQINFGGGVKSVSDSSDQLVFPDKEPVEKKPRKSSQQASVLSEATDDEEVLDSHVGFDDEDFDEDFLDGLPSTESASVEPRENVLDDEDEDGVGKDSGYFDRLKSVFGDQ
jgi:hypothetical protein